MLHFIPEHRQRSDRTPEGALRLRKNGKNRFCCHLLTIDLLIYRPGCSDALGCSTTAERRIDHSYISPAKLNISSRNSLKPNSNAWQSKMVCQEAVKSPLGHLFHRPLSRRKTVSGNPDTVFEYVFWPSYSSYHFGLAQSSSSMASCPVDVPKCAQKLAFLPYEQ